MSRSAQQIRFCRSRDGTRIAYATSGSGPLLVWAQHWVHHLDLDWDHPVWNHLLTFLSKRHTLIRYDWRGCGLSDRDRLTFSFDRLYEDLEAVIDAAGEEQFILFGMGGAGGSLAVRYTALNPQRVRRLILHEAHAQHRMADHSAPELLHESDARLKVYELGWSDDTPAYGQFFTALHIPDASREEARACNALLRQTTSLPNALGLLRAFRQADVRDLAPKVSCPTLFLHARGDKVIPFQDGRELATLIPHSRFVPLESRHNLLLASEPAWQQARAVLEEFLAPSHERTGPSFEQLTAREREVLEALAQGLNNRAIAEKLKIAEKTARNHVSIILGKLDVSSRTQAVVLARESGLGGKGGRV